MSISIQLPAHLLQALDRRARAVRVGRNRLIVEAIERVLREGRDWSPGFLDRLAEPSPELSQAIHDILIGIRRSRRSKAM